MFKGVHDIFALVMIFWGSNLKSKHVILGLFEVFEIIRQALTKKLIEFLNEYGLRNKIIEYVKGKGSNLNMMTNAIKFVVKCDNLSLEESF